MADVVPISDRLRTARDAVLRDHLEAFNTGDVDAVMATYSTPRLEVVPTARVIEGADAVRTYYAERLRAFPDQRCEPIAVHHSDDAVIVEYWLSGTHTGDVPGVDASGKRFRARMVVLFAFDGDALVNQRIYFDTGTIARQLA